jgi:hypothetical protein
MSGECEDCDEHSIECVCPMVWPIEKYNQLLANRRIVNDCWEWMGAKQKKKIPMTTLNGRSISVRRCMHILHYGIEVKSPIYTRCGNLKCFNPDHLTTRRPRERRFYE